MVLKIEPLVDAVESIQKAIGEQAQVIYFSPAGKQLNTENLRSFPPAAPNHLIFVCGHYEGVDQRFVDYWVDHEISLGDFVLTGGELPAVAMADALIRQIDGALGNPRSTKNESFSLRFVEAPGPCLEYPHYTRPPTFRGHKIPEILLTGDHARIEAWRKEQSLQRTQKRRPDLTRSS